jgi:DNA-binding transcriptional LysR family regulator
MLSQSAQTPRGRLRISLPTLGYHFLLPALPDFKRRYPDVELNLDFNDHIIDLIETEIDVVIRSGVLPDSRLISRKLGPFRFVLGASEAYLKENGVPETPKDLERHDCLHFRFPGSEKLMDWSISTDHIFAQSTASDTGL